MKKYECEYCLKKYSRVHYFKQHYRFCHELHNTKRLKEIRCQEEYDIPSVKELYSVIQTLLTKYETLEKEVQLLRQQAKIQTKKLDIHHWLSTNVVVDTYIKDEFYDKLDNIHLDTSWYQSLSEGLVSLSNRQYMEKVLTLLIEHLENNNKSAKLTLNIQGFSNKKVLYTYNEEYKKWCDLKPDKMEKLQQQLYKHQMLMIQKWKEVNKEKLMNDSDLYQNTYVPMLNKILSSNISLSDLYTLLYDKLHQDASVLHITTTK